MLLSQVHLKVTNCARTQCHASLRNTAHTLYSRSLCNLRNRTQPHHDFCFILINHASLLCHCVFLLENWPEAVLRKSRSLTEVWHWESVGCAPLGELVEKEMSFSMNFTK